MIDYETLENDIVAQLAPLESLGIDVEPLPETDRKNELVSGKPRITVSYVASEFSDQIIKGHPNNFSTGIVNQDEYANIGVTLRAKLLRGSKGIYQMRVLVQKHLLGFQPQQWGRLFLKSVAYEEREKNIWTYIMVFVCKAVAVQHLSDAPLNLTNSDNTGLTPAANGTPLEEVTINTNC